MFGFPSPSHAFLGPDTKLMQNSGRTKFKRTSIDRLMNTLVLWVRLPTNGSGLCPSSYPWAGPVTPISPPWSVVSLQVLTLKPLAGQPLKGSVYFRLLLDLEDVI